MSISLFFCYQCFVIFGFGLVGWIVVVYVVCVNLKLVVIIGLQQGGQLMIIIEVDNWLGDVYGLMGLDLMVCMQVYVECFEIEVIFDYIYIVDLLQCLFKLIGDSYEYICDVLIIVIGVIVKYLGILIEEIFKGRGVFVCVICDGFFYCDQDVVVVGGGNIVVEEVLYLFNIVCKVYLVYCCDILKVEKIMQDKLFRKVVEGKIEIVWYYQVEEVLGNDVGVIGVCVKFILDGSICDIDVYGFFVVIGYYLNIILFDGQLVMNNGYLEICLGLGGNVIQILVEGVFVVGDVVDQYYC